MAISESLQSIAQSYTDFTNQLPLEMGPMINVFIFAILIVLYSLFTWKFYRYISKRDLIELNLSQYNHTTHPVLNKLFAAFLYLIEYIIVLPFLIFFWFAVLAVIILLLSEGQTINQVVIITAAIIAAIRMLSYYEEDLSRDLAKMFPFTVLAISILTPGFFQLGGLVDNIVQIPNILVSLLYFLGLIIIVEIILRIIDTIVHFFKSEKEEI